MTIQSFQYDIEFSTMSVRLRKIMISKSLYKDNSWNIFQLQSALPETALTLNLNLDQY